MGADPAPRRVRPSGAFVAPRPASEDRLRVPTQSAPAHCGLITCSFIPPGYAYEVTPV